MEESDENLLAEGWRIDGDDYLGCWVLREYAPNVRRPEKKKACYGQIRYWLPADVDDPFLDAENKPASLWKVEYIMPPDLDCEDLEIADLSSCIIGAESVPEEILSRAERTRQRRIKRSPVNIKKKPSRNSKQEAEQNNNDVSKRTAKKRARRNEDQTNETNENNEEDIQALEKFATRWMPRRSAKDQALIRGFKVDDAFQSTTQEERQESAELVLKAVEQAAAEQGTAWVSRRQIGKRCRQLAENEDEASFHRVERAIKLLIEQGKLLSSKRGSGICLALAGSTDMNTGISPAISPSVNAYNKAVSTEIHGLSHWLPSHRGAKFIATNTDQIDNTQTISQEKDEEQQDGTLSIEKDEQQKTPPTTKKEQNEDDNIAPPGPDTKSSIVDMEEDDESDIEALVQAAAVAAVEDAMVSIRTPARSALALFKEEHQAQALSDLLPNGYNHIPARNWHRTIKQRIGDPNKSDCYYFGPDGSLMRSGSEIAAFLEAHPDQVDSEDRDGAPLVLTRDSFTFGQRVTSPIELRECPYIQHSQISDLINKWWSELSLDQQAKYEIKVKEQQNAAQMAVKSAVRKTFVALSDQITITANDLALMCVVKVAPLAETAWPSLGRLNKWRQLVPDEDDENLGFPGAIDDIDALVVRLDEHLINPTSSLKNSHSLAAGGRQRTRRAAAVRSRANYVDKPATPAEVVDSALEFLESCHDTNRPLSEQGALSRGVPLAALSNDLVSISEVVSKNEQNKPVAKQCHAFNEAPVRAIRDGVATLVKSHRAKRFLAQTDDSGIIEEHSLTSSETPCYVSPADDFGNGIQTDSPAQVRNKLRQQYIQRHFRTLVELRALVLHRLTARTMPPDDQTLELVNETKAKYNALIGARIEFDGVLGVCINSGTAKMDDGTTKSDLTVEQLGRAAARCQPSVIFPALVPDPLKSQTIMVYWPKDHYFYTASVVASAPTPVWNCTLLPPRRPGISYAPAHLVVYEEDASSEWLDLRQYTVRYAKAVTAFEECYNVIQQLTNKDYTNLFAEAVNPDVDPSLANYRNVITNPMDFGTVFNRLFDNTYDNDASLAMESLDDDEEEDDIDLFVDTRNDALTALRLRRGVYRDLKLTLENAILYNRTSRPDIVHYSSSLLNYLNSTSIASALAENIATNAKIGPTTKKHGQDDSRFLLDDDDDDWDDDEEDWDDDERPRTKRARHNSSTVSKVSRYLIDNVVTLDTLLAQLPIHGDPTHFAHPPGFHLTRTLGRSGRVSHRSSDSYRPVTLREVSDHDNDNNFDEAKSILQLLKPESEPIQSAPPIPAAISMISYDQHQSEMTPSAVPMAEDQPPQLDSGSPLVVMEDEQAPVIKEEHNPLPEATVMSEVLPAIEKDDQRPIPTEDRGTDLKYNSRSALESNHFETLHTSVFSDDTPYLGIVVDGFWEIRTAYARLALAHVVGTLVATGHVIEVGTGPAPTFVPAHLYLRSTPPTVEKKHRSREDTYMPLKEKSEYELMREARIEANNAFLAQLGLGGKK